MRPGPIGFDGVWIGQLISEAGNPRQYRVASIRTNQEQIVVRAVGGKNTRIVSKVSLDLSWFPAGVTVSDDGEGKT